MDALQTGWRQPSKELTPQVAKQSYLSSPLPPLLLPVGAGPTAPGTKHPASVAACSLLFPSSAALPLGFSPSAAQVSTWPLPLLPFPSLPWGWQDCGVFEGAGNIREPFSGERSLQKVGVALWKKPAPFAWEPGWEVLRKPKHPGLGHSTPPPCPTSPRWPRAPTCCSRSPQGCWANE